MQWMIRTNIVRILFAADPTGASHYLKRNNVAFTETLANSTGTASPQHFPGVAYRSSQLSTVGDGDCSPHEGCTPLYRVLQTIPDDFDVQSATVAYVTLLRDLMLPKDAGNDGNQTVLGDRIGIGNAADGDKPLALLYRRFTRQFDLAEKFFAGDNSRPAVVDHRRRYKVAAGNTWKMIELLLRPDPVVVHNGTTTMITTPEWHLVHRAVQVETPPDLLRYIVETNAEDLTAANAEGNLPLHYAAKSKPPAGEHGGEHFPAFYTKYVVDELLYKFPEAASIRDAQGQYPFTLAVHAGKHWIGGGIKSLYDAYPEAMEQVNAEEHASLMRMLSIDVEFKEEKTDDAATSPLSSLPIIRDEQYDAIMLVQQDKVQVSEVVTSMWAHEEDAGVQMLGCVAISKMVRNLSMAAAAKSVTPRALGTLIDVDADDGQMASRVANAAVLSVALSAVAAVVNAMKAHPNEVIVQEKACHALKLLACTDGQREVSFVASGAVAAIVGAMQAHVSDSGVQEESCAAIAEIIHFGGEDRATIVASVSGLTALMNAVAAHAQVRGVQREGCRALRELTEFPHANLPELPRSQTEPLLLAARDRFPEDCGEAVDLLVSRLS
jgi:hypothetical protein